MIRDDAIVSKLVRNIIFGTQISASRLGVKVALAAGEAAACAAEMVNVSGSTSAGMPVHELSELEREAEKWK